MEKLTIKVISTKDINTLVNLANQEQGDITIYKGRYAIDCKSLMGVLAIGIYEPVIIEYPKEVSEYFKTYISIFEVVI